MGHSSLEPEKMFHIYLDPKNTGLQLFRAQNYFVTAIRSAKYLGNSYL